MKGKLRYQINGIVVSEQGISVNCGGDSLHYKAYPGAKIVPWPLDADGNPLPVELDLKSITVNE